jgi:hypothetical protein
VARKVSVGLEADVAGFIGPVLEAAGATEKLDDKVDELDRSLNKIPADALKAGAAMKLLSGDIGDVHSNISKIGDTSTSINVLSSRIRAVRTEVRQLTEEFLKTGDVDVFHKLNLKQGELGTLTRIRKDLANSIEDGLKDGVKRGGPSAANSFTQLLQGGIIKALTANPQILAAAAGLAALLAIPIGAVIGGAVLAGAGAGAAGFAGFAATQADKNGQIAKAGGDLVAKVNAQITSGGASAIGPLLAGIHELSRALDDVHLDQIIQAGAKFIEPLAAGAARFATYLSQGVADLIDASGPAVQVLAEELPALGRSIKSAFDSIAGGSEGGTRALQDFLHWVEAFIVATGQIIGYLEKAYGAVRSFGDGFESFIDKARDANPILSGLLAPTAALLDFFDTGKDKAQQYAHSLGDANERTKLFGDATKGIPPDFDALTASISKTTGTIDTFAGAVVDKMLNTLLSLDHAALGFEESLTRLGESVKDNGRSLDIHTAKGQANREAILGLVEANQRSFDANIANGDSIAVATGKYDTNTGRIYAAAKAAGFNTTQIHAMIDKYAAVPDNVNTTVQANGLSDAIDGLILALGYANRLDGNRADFFVYEHRITQYTTTYTGQGLGHQGRAAGGPVNRGQTYLVGEQGPELFKAPVNGQIMTAAQTSRMMSTNMAGSHGPASAAPQAPMPPMQRFEEAFAWMFLRLKQRGAI